MSGEIVPRAWLGNKTTLDRAARDSLEAIRGMRSMFLGLDIPEVPFGFENAKWRSFCAQIEPGDEIYEFNSPQELWAKGQGRVGLVAYRGGVLIASMISSGPEDKS